MSRIGTDGYTWNRALWDCLTHYHAEKEYLANILKNTSGHDSLISYMTEIHCEETSGYIRGRTGNRPLDASMKMYIRLYCMGTVCLIAGRMET